jgi:phage recombination protein Bet
MSNEVKTTSEDKALQIYNFLNISENDKKKIFDQNYLKLLLKEHKDLDTSYIVQFLQKAMILGADPRINQVYLLKHFSSKEGRYVGTVVFNYHFMLNVANQTGEYEGVIVEYKTEDVFDPIKKETTKEAVATAQVRRKGITSSYTAYWSECYNSKNPIWNTRGKSMLQKCAVVGAIRLAFPESTSGMYIEEEISDNVFNHNEARAEQVLNKFNEE